MLKEKCKVVGCTNIATRKGLCCKHYMRTWRHGSPYITKNYCDSLTTSGGLSRKYPREYNSYRNMRTRCMSKSHAQYKDYGGRGIKICDRWLEPGKGFENFLNDMVKRPKGLSLDRINPDGPYSPDNCRWASRKEQANNRRQSISIQGNGGKIEKL